MRKGKVDMRRMRSKAFMEELEKVLSKHTDKCFRCGASLIPDKKAVRFGTKKWDGHTWKFDCDCHPKGFRISIG